MDRRGTERGAMRAFTNAMIAPPGPGRAAQPAAPAPQPARAPAAAAAPMPAQAPAPAPERRGLLGGFFGPEGRDARARLAIGLEGMTLNPNEALIGQLQRGIQSRETAAQKNATVEWLKSRGREDLAAAIEGGLPAADALRIAMEPAPQADPLAAINLEKAKIELQRLKSGADMDPNVQSSAPLPDQSGVVLTMRDGSVQVRTVGGGVVTGQAAMDFVRTAQENAAEYQRSIYGARREGTLGADIGMGEEAAAAGARGTELGRAQGAAIAGAPTDIATADMTLQYIDEVRQHPGIDIGTGATSVANILPGTPGYEFQRRVDQLLAGGFLTAIDQLRGMGALSNVEGQTATRAISRMDTATRKDEFLDALADYEAVVKMGRERASSRIQQPATEQPAAPIGMPSDDDLLRMYGG
jgi:hypothetical protein